MADIVGVPGLPLGASNSAQFPITVSSILKQPTFVQQYLLRIADYLFVSEKIFRQVQSCPSGAVVYYASTPLFANVHSSVLEEFEEIPVGMTDLGTPAVATANRQGLGVRVSEQMRTRNDINALNIQLEQVRNTLVLDFDANFMGVMEAAVPEGHVTAATAVWSSSSSTMRADVSAALATIVAEKRGFRPDTLLIDQATLYGLLGNDDTWQIFRGNVANENPQLLGKLSAQILGLDVFVTINGNITSGDAFVMQRNVFGGYSDERPLTATPWYLNQDNESWRSNVTRSSAVFIDQPLALGSITGVS